MPPGVWCQGFWRQRGRMRVQRRRYGNNSHLLACIPLLTTNTACEVCLGYKALESFSPSEQFWSLSIPSTAMASVITKQASKQNAVRNKKVFQSSNSTHCFGLFFCLSPTFSLLPRDQLFFCSIVQQKNWQWGCRLWQWWKQWICWGLQVLRREMRVYEARQSRGGHLCKASQVPVSSGSGTNPCGFTHKLLCTICEPCFFSFFFFLIYFWLRWVLVAARGIFIAALAFLSICGVRA